MLLQYILFAFVIISNLILGAIVLLRKRNRTSGVLFGIAVLSISLWAIGDMLLLGANEQALAQFGAYLFYIAPMTIPITLWWFSLIFPEEKRLSNTALLGGVLSFLFVSGIIIYNLNWLIEPVLISEPMNVATPETPGFYLYTAYLTIFFSLTYVVLFRKLVAKRGLAKQQIAYTMLGTIFASAPALTTNLVLPLMGTKHLIWLGPIFSLLSVTCVTVAMVKHRMFDVRLVAARSLAYVFSLAVLASLYGVVVFAFVVSVFDLNISLPVQVFISAATAFAAISFSRIKSFFDRLTNRLFYQDAYDAQSLISQLNRVLVSNTEIEPLLQQAVSIIGQNMKPEFCMFALRETKYLPRRFIGEGHPNFTEEETRLVREATVRLRQRVVIADEIIEHEPELYRVMRRRGVDVLARLVTDVGREKQGVGYLILGPKKSGNPYNSRDIEVVSIIAGEFVIAIQNVLRFEEIEKFSVTLQRNVDDATLKLRRTNDKLKAMDETKDDFISMASHQLRTPLTSIKGYVSMVLDGDMGEINPAQRQALNQALISSQRMVFLIADLLNLSRLKTGKFVIEPIPTKLADIIESEVKQLQETAKARELELIYRKPAHFPVLMLDETKIRQVAMNFMDNAIYYTHAGGHIAVELKETEKTIEFTVTDDGIGVPKHEQPHLFNKFYRAGNARKARPDGTGLGLFMAKKVIVAQGGSIIFHSKEGKGSTFGFSFAKARLVAPPNANPVFHESSHLAVAEKSLNA